MNEFAYPDRYPYQDRFIAGGISIPEPVGRSLPPPYSETAIYLGRAFQGRRIVIGITPSLILSSNRAWPYLILNPSREALLTSSALGKTSSTETEASHSQASPVNVAGFESAHFFLRVAAITGNWDIWLQTYDEMSETWTDAQQLFSAIGALGTFYAPGGSIGIASQIAFRWYPVTAGSITFSIGVTLKSGLGGSAGGLDQFIYIGGEQVNVNDGYPILEGQEKVFIIGENVELYGVGRVSGLEVRVFEL